jgi:hypothetical protein
MTSLRRTVALTLGAMALAAGSLVASTSTAMATNSDGWNPPILKLTTETIDFTVIDVGAPGPALGQGDQIISADKVFKNGKEIGTDGVVCTVVNATQDALTCQWVMTLSLPDGQLTLQGIADGPTGPPTEPLAFTLAVTGGTGHYRGAGGSADILDNPGGTEQVTVRLTR